jgi:outer membrane protein
LEQKNEQIAKQNLDITLDKFTIGKIPAVDFRVAQQNYSNTVIRLTEAHFLAKQSELFLLELAGNIVVD